MKRNLMLSAVVAVVLMAGAALLFSQASAAGKPSAVSAEQCFAQSEQATFYVRGYDKYGTLKSTGSGFLVTSDGLAVTATHVVQEMTRVTVLLGETELEVKVLSADEKSDVALLRFPAGRRACLPVADKAPAAGAVVRAMGYPMKGTLIITEGIVNNPLGTISGKERMLVSCSLVSGMSGGPVLDAYGRVVGVNSGSVRTMSGIHLSTLTDKLNAAISAAKEAKQ